MVKSGSGTLWLTSPTNNTFSGDIVIERDGGILQVGINPLYSTVPEVAGLALPGMTAANRITVKTGGKFYIHENITGSISHHYPNRLGSPGNRPALVLEGGIFTFYGPNVTDLYGTQTVSQVTIASGVSTLQANNNGNGKHAIVADSLTIAPGAYLICQGRTLGEAVGQSTRIFFNTPPAMIGGGGGDNSPTRSIIPAARIGSDYVTYGALGVRVLTAAEYNSTADVNSAGNTDNVKLNSAAPTALSADKTINSLHVSTTGTWNMGAGKTLTLTSGQMMTAAQLTMAQGNLTAGSGGDVTLNIAPIANSTISGNIIDNGGGAVKLVKSGTAILTLSGTNNTYSGGTVVNEGTLQTSGSVPDSRFFGSGPVLVDCAVLSVTAPGATSYGGDDYTATNAAHIYIASMAFTAADKFNIEAGSVLAGANSAANMGLNSLERGVNVTLAADAVVAHNSPLAAPFNPATGTIKSLGSAADLFYGLNNNQSSASGALTIGAGTPFKGVSTDRVARYWSLGTISVAPGTADIWLQGLPALNAAPFVLYMGNGVTAGGPVIALNGNGAVNAHVVGYVTLDDDAAVYGATNSGDVVNFVVEKDAMLTANRANCMGSGDGIAAITVKDGGTLTTVTTVANDPWAAFNGPVTVEAGGLLIVNTPLGLTGSGQLTLKSGAIVEVTYNYSFRGSQAAAAIIEPGVIFRFQSTNFGTANDTLDNYLRDASPIMELYYNNAGVKTAGNKSAVAPLFPDTTVLPLNRGAGGLGGMLINDDYGRNLTSAGSGTITIGANGGVMAATRYTSMAVPQPFDLGANELIIGSTNVIGSVDEPKLGTVLINAIAGLNRADPGGRINVIPGAELRNGANSLPDKAEIRADGLFYVAAADIVGGLSGTGIVNVAVALTIGDNNLNASFGGTLNGTAALVKRGTGRQEITGGANGYSGAIRVAGGELALSGAGTLGNTGTGAYTLESGGTLHLDNSAVNNGNRLSGASPRINFNGGTFRFTGKDGAASSEAVEVASLNSGESRIEIINGSGSGSSAQLTFSGLSGNTAGTVNFAASNGTLGMAGDNPRVKFTGLAAGLIQGARVGNNLAWYDTTDGVRAFTVADGVEFDGNANQSGKDTVFTTANANPVLTAARTVNSLWISSPGSGKAVDLNAYGLTVTGGRILLSGSDNFAITRTGSGTLSCSPTYLMIGVDNKGTVLALAVPTAKAIAKDGAGTLLLDETFTFTSMVINNGVVKYGPNGDLAATTLQTWNKGMLDLAGKSDTLGAMELYEGGITNSNASSASTLTISTLTMGSGPAGSESFVRLNAGDALLLGGNVTYNLVNDPGAAYISGGTLNLNGAARTFTVNDSVAANIDFDISSSIAGAAGFGITKAGAGALRLGGSNSFDGPVSVAGTLILAHPQAHGAPSVSRTLSVASAATLAFHAGNGSIAVPATYALNINGAGDQLFGFVASGALVNMAGTNSAAGAVTLAGAATIAVQGGRMTLSGNISGNAALTVNGSGDLALAGVRSGDANATLVKNGAGTLIVSGNNTCQGVTTINAGAVNVRHSNGLGAATAATTVQIGGELQLQDGISVGAKPLAINGQGVAGGGALRNVGGTNSYAGKVTLGIMNTRINSDAGKLKLDVASGNAVESVGYSLLLGGGGDIEVADPIAIGTGGVIKDGSGAVTLGAANTSTGPTTVEAGTLAVNGSLNASSVVTVKGGVLAGNGSVLGSATAQTGGTVAPGVPGSAGGTLTIARLIMETGSALAFEFSNAPANDKLSVSVAGGFTIASGCGIYLYKAGTTDPWDGTGVFSLVQYAGTLNGNVGSLAIANPHPDQCYTIFAEGNWIKVRIEPVRVAALAASDLTPSGARLNGKVLQVAADNPKVWFCLDTSDKGTAATSAWSRVEYVGVYGEGQLFDKVVGSLLSGSNYTYRVFAANLVGSSWSLEAASFRPVYLPTVANRGAERISLGVARLRGEVTDIGSEAPQVRFHYWKVSDNVTNVLNVGVQSGLCDVLATGLELSTAYEFRIEAENQAGKSWSAVAGFTSAGIYYVRTDGSDAASGLSWAEAKQTFASAIAAAGALGTVIVSNGVYVISNPLAITNAINLKSANGAETVSLVPITSPNTVSPFLIDHPGALVEGITITGCVSRLTYNVFGPLYLSNGTVRACVIANNVNNSSGAGMIAGNGFMDNCVITNNRSTHVNSGYGGGLRMTGGTVSRCLIANNTGTDGGGGMYMTGGVVSNTVFRNNLKGNGNVNRHGGGLWMTAGYVANCLFYGNRITSQTGYGSGAAVEGGVMVNCTIADNLRDWGNDFAGLYQSGGAVSNVVSYYNGAIYPAGGLENIANVGGTVAYSCTQPLVSGPGNVAGNPNFVNRGANDYHLLYGSACIDAGVDVGLGADLDGNPRPVDGDGFYGTQFDIGCYEAEAAGNTFACTFTGAPLVGTNTLATVFNAAVVGPGTNNVFYSWDFDGDGIPDAAGYGLNEVTNVYPSPGYYSITLVCTNALGAEVTLARADYVQVYSLAAYVATSGSRTKPYDTWAKAAAGLQEAIDVVADGGTVYVSNGIYTVNSKINVFKAVTVTGVNGPEGVILKSPGANRLMDVNHAAAIVEKLSFTGINLGYPDSGAILLDNGLVRYCLITNNVLGTYGGGIHINNGLAHDLRLLKNTAGHQNTGYGGGAYLTGGVLSNSVVVGNIAWDAGGGIGVAGAGARVTQCIITNNHMVGNNLSTRGGGGVWMSAGKVDNCLIAYNYTKHDSQTQGGGIYMYGVSSWLVNNTVVGNWRSSGDVNSGLYMTGGNVLNSIVWGNSSNATPVSTENVYKSGGNFDYSLTEPAVAGNSNIAANPIFRKQNAGDFRLSTGSPAINAGNTQPEMRGGRDVTGKARVLGARVDMGAYESQHFRNTVLLLR